MESAIEISIWFFFAVAIGLTIVGFFYHFNYTGFAQDIKNIIIGNEKASLKDGMNLTSFVFYTLNIWKKCGYGSVNYSEIITYNDSKILNKSNYFSIVKKYQLCNIIRSSEYNCPSDISGKGIEDLNISSDVRENGTFYVQVACNPKREILVFS